MLVKYSDYLNVFSFDLVIELSKNIGINKYAMKLIRSIQLFYKLIYALSLIELEILKTYIKTYLKIGFIKYFKSTASAPILFNKKINNSLHLCVDYQGLNNLTMKNQYFLSLIDKILD